MLPLQGAGNLERPGETWGDLGRAARRLWVTEPRPGARAHEACLLPPRRLQAALG